MDPVCYLGSIVKFLCVWTLCVICVCLLLCLKEGEKGIIGRIERSMVRLICGVQLKDEKRCTDLMFMLGLNENKDLSAIANCVRWHCRVLRRALDLEVKGRKGG